MHVLFYCSTLTSQPSERHIHFCQNSVKYICQISGKTKWNKWTNRWKNPVTTTKCCELNAFQESWHVILQHISNVQLFISDYTWSWLWRRTLKDTLQVLIVYINILSHTALKGSCPKLTAVFVLFHSLLLRSWFYGWLVNCLTLFTLREVLRDHQFYSKLKKLQRWALLWHGEGASDEQLCCRVGTIALKITLFHGKSIALLLLFSVKLCTCSPESQADLSEHATSEVLIYTENSVASSLYFFVGPALDNACWVDPLRGSLQRKGQYSVSSIIYDKNAGKHRKDGLKYS